MSNFIKLGPCPYCGSKDNRAEYQNGYWCFGCSKLEIKEDTKTLRERVYKTNTLADGKSIYLIETIKDIPQMAMRWLLKYDITREEILKYGISWDPVRKLLVLLKNKNYWQARNFGFGNLKYLSQGMKPLTIYGEGDTIVLVEDVLSAIKIARLRYDGYSASPLLGSSLSKQAEAQLIRRYKKIYIWLDRDKAKNAIRIKNRLRSLGVISKAIITELDPKEYNKEKLKEFLND